MNRKLDLRPESRGTTYASIYAVVRRIPRGRVATYGQVARLAGLGGHARQVGYGLYALNGESAIPWQRVINARGEVSPRTEPGMDFLQRQRLEAEGVRFDARGRVDLARFQWRPRSVGGTGRLGGQERVRRGTGHDRLREQ